LEPTTVLHLNSPFDKCWNNALQGTNGLSQLSFQNLYDSSVNNLGSIKNFYLRQYGLWTSLSANQPLISVVRSGIQTVSSNVSTREKIQWARRHGMPYNVTLSLIFSLIAFDTDDQGMLRNVFALG
jgi:hypothetical protein